MDPQKKKKIAAKHCFLLSGFLLHRGMVNFYFSLLRTLSFRQQWKSNSTPQLPNWPHSPKFNKHSKGGTKHERNCVFSSSSHHSDCIDNHCYCTFVRGTRCFRRRTVFLTAHQTILLPLRLLLLVLFFNIAFFFRKQLFFSPSLLFLPSQPRENYSIAIGPPLGPANNRALARQRRARSQRQRRPSRAQRDRATR